MIPPTAAMLAIKRLTEIMATLRSPAGCPWDAEQTPQMLKPYIIEEAYEVIEAIDAGDPKAIEEELGDLLLQIVFQARIHEECGIFDLAGVANTIADKLVRRHPHVFGNVTIVDPELLHAQWEAIKAEEKRSSNSRPAGPAGSHKSLPALMRAYKVAEKESRAGREGTPLEELLHLAGQGVERISDGINTIQTKKQPDRQASLEFDLGRLLFTLVEIGRLAGIDSEDALRKFIDQRIAKTPGTTP